MEMKANRLNKIERIVRRLERVVDKLNSGFREEVVSSLKVDILNILAKYGINQDTIPKGRIEDLVDELVDEIVIPYAEGEY
jgi:septum formation topological specificity factor MinE